MAKLPAYAIVADIGGTNARFSRVDLATLALDKVAVYPCADFPTLADALSHYRQQQQLTAISHVAIAIACPVTSDIVSMTNFHWTFSIKAMQQQLQLDNQRLMMDVAVKNAFRDYELQKQNLVLEEENILLAKENVTIALERFRLGVSTYIELREAQISLNDGYNRLIAARYNAKVAEVELMRLKGEILK